MTILHLIRHGRASALEADYDQLHTMGQTQARLLGVHLGRERRRFDAVYVGPLRRQLDTLRLMREAAEPSGLQWPEATVLPGLAEGPFETLFKVYMRPRIKVDPVLQEHMATMNRAADDAGRRAALEAMFDRMVDLWRAREVVGDDLETAAAFEARVNEAKETIASREGEGRQVAVVTSNGVIGHLLQDLAGLQPKQEGARHRLYNTSVSVLELAKDTPRLHDHNQTAHIADPELLTLL